jgi:hypothetical protein
MKFHFWYVQSTFPNPFQNVVSHFGFELFCLRQDARMAYGHWGEYFLYHASYFLATPLCRLRNRKIRALPSLIAKKNPNWTEAWQSKSPFVEFPPHLVFTAKSLVPRHSPGVTDPLSRILRASYCVRISG